MEDAYVDKLKKWIELDNSIAQHKEDMSGFVEEKKQLEDDILEYIEKNNLDRVTVNVSDGTLKFPKRKIQQAFTMKYIKTTLQKYVQIEENNSIDVDSVYNFLVSNLETKNKTYIKRDIHDR